MRARTLLIPIALCAVAACLGDTTSPTIDCPDPGFTTTTRGDTVVSNSTLRYINLSVGTGATAEVCRVAAVRYVGRLTTGEVFDSTDTGAVLRFSPGLDAIIPGFAEGVLGMKVGGQRRLIIPPALGYGPGTRPARGPGFAAIPANATLVFDITLVGTGQ